MLDATKVIPEELVPLRPVGRMVLDRTVDNFFAETEQVAFCTSNVVPGIDFSDDPLLQGRNFSYLDTQLKRLGGPNFHQLPINRPRCPMANFQRDGHMQMDVPKGRVNYSPSALSNDAPRENPTAGYTSFAEPVEGHKARHRSETFADHFSQARMFFDSQTMPEQNHIISALIFELSKVETAAVREAVLAQLANIGSDIASRVAKGIGMHGKVSPAKAARPTRTDLAPSPALSILAKAVPTLKGRKVGILIADGTDAAEIQALTKDIEAQGGKVAIIAPKVGGAEAADGKPMVAHFQLAGGPSVLFDAVAIVVSAAGAEMLEKEAAAVAFVHDAFQHLKVIGHNKAAMGLLTKAGVKADEGVVALGGFAKAAAGGRIWEREKTVRTVF